MESIKRDLILGASMCALVFTCALALGSPFVNRYPDATRAPQVQGPQPTVTPQRDFHNIPI